MLDCLGRLRDPEHQIHLTIWKLQQSHRYLVWPFCRIDGRGEGGNEEEKSESMTCGA